MGEAAMTLHGAMLNRWASFSTEACGNSWPGAVCVTIFVISGSIACEPSKFYRCRSCPDRSFLCGAIWKNDVKKNGSSKCGSVLLVERWKGLVAKATRAFWKGMKSVEGWK